MNKFKWIRATVVALLAFVSVWQLHAERRCVYVAGADGKWQAPMTQFQEDWDSLRIWETSEGSNVYEGTLPVQTLLNLDYEACLYFRFVTRLAEHSDSFASWHENFVGPDQVGHYGDVYINTRSGVAYSSALSVKEYSPAEACAWCVTVPEGTDKMKFHLDLNKNEMWTISDKAIVPVFNSDVKPTIKAAVGMISVSGGKEAQYFVPAGDCSFRLYNVCEDAFVGPKSATSIGADKTRYSLKGEAGSENSWTVESWDGGILTFNMYAPKDGYIRINNSSQSSTPLPQLSDMNYLVVVTPDDDIKIDADNFSYVINSFPHLEQTVSGVYEGQLSGQKAVKFLKKVGATSDQNEYISAGDTDRELSYRREVAYSSYVSGRDNSGYWKNADQASKVKVDLNSNNYNSVQFGEENNGSDFIYVVGTNSGWTIPSQDNYDFYQGHRIFSTTDGKYYGSVEAVKDDFGDVSFRFFTKLDGWTSTYSIGSYPEDFHDMPAECDGGEYDLVMNGLGNFCFSNYTGDRIYILADLANRKVKFSSTPLDVEIGAVDDTPECSFISGDIIVPVTDYYFAHSSDSDELLIHSRKMPFTSDEPEWMGSYLLEPADPNAKLVLNEYGVARIALKEKNVVSDVRGNGISLADLPLGMYNAKVSDDNKELIVYEQNRLFLLGELTDNRTLTFDNGSSFEGYTIDPYFGGVFYIPAGKFDFCIGTYNNQNPEGVYEIQWSNGVYSFSQNYIYSLNQLTYQTRRFVDYSWQGGWIAITERGIFDLAKCEIYILAKNDWQKLNQIGDPKDLKFNCTYAEIGGNQFAEPQLRFHILANNQYYPFLGAPVYYDYQLSNENIGNANTDIDGEQVELPVKASEWSYHFPYFKDIECSVSLDLKKMTATIVPYSVTKFDKYTVSSNHNAVNGTELIETFDDQNILEGFINVQESQEDVEVNVVTANNTILVPSDANQTVTFDEHGCYSCAYNIVPINESSSENALGQASHWIIPAKYTGGEVSFRIDRINNILYVSSAKAIKNYYVVDGNEDYQSIAHSVFELPQLSGRELKETSANVYEGNMQLPQNNRMNIIGGVVTHGLLTYAVCSRYYYDDNTLVDMKSPEDEVLLLRLSTNWYYENPWQIDGDENKGVHHLILDLNNYTLTIKKDLSSVDEVESVDGVKVEGLQGVLRVTSDTDMLLAVYNLQGTLVKLLNVNQGITETNLPAGLYIAAGKKVMVR